MPICHVIRTILIAQFFLASLHGVSKAQSDGWRSDLPTAFEEAQRLNRPLLLHFHRDACIPCRVMERSVLHQPEVLALLRKDYIAVQVNTEHYPKLTSQLGVTTVPTDVFLDPDGRPRARAVGKADLPLYMARLTEFAEKYQPRQIIADRDDDADVTAPDPRGHSAPKNNATPASSNSTIVGLDGYCPVRLWNDKQWVKGKRRFAAEYSDITYRMETAENARSFVRNPARYAPQLLGCDPVVLSESGRAVAGSTRFCARYDGELYLFVSSATKAQFMQDPTSFIETERELSLNEIERHTGSSVSR